MRLCFRICKQPVFSRRGSNAYGIHIHRAGDDGIPGTVQLGGGTCTVVLIPLISKSPVIFSGKLMSPKVQCDSMP